jgi:DNA-binding NtrC family response regulator
MPHVLIVDDDAECVATLRDCACADGGSCVVTSQLRQALTHCALQPPDWIVAADTLPDGEGLALLDALRGDDAVPLILLTASPSLERAVDAFRRGVADYLVKPVDTGRLRTLLGTRAAKSRSDTRNEQAPPLLGESPAMQTLREHVARVAPTEASVLLEGESGTGKELVAQNIHAQSLRHRQPFLPVNCGAISPQLIESEIFGHEKGSFTGADRQHKGYFERASGGTLFLDEISEMPTELQVKLLRVLETGSFMRIGSNQELHTDVRIVAATNRDPEGAIAEGRLRLDLFHRLNVFPLTVPPLRERGDDIALLASHFLAELNRSHGTGKRLSARALETLQAYHWPGNVRELRNVVQRAYILSDQHIDALALGAGPSTASGTPLTLAVPVGSTLADADRQLIFATLDLCGGVKKRAADLLGISLKTLYNRLDDYGGVSATERRDDAGFERSLLN